MRKPLVHNIARLLLASAILAGSAGMTLAARALPKADWLLNPKPYQAAARLSASPQDLVLENGLIRRVFRLQPGAATVAFDNLTTGEALLRSVRPEALITLDGVRLEVGGLTGQPLHNFLKPLWLESMKATPGALRFVRHEIGRTKERFPWKKRKEWIAEPATWPPPGVSLTLEFATPSRVDQGTTNHAPPGITVEVHYELYDGIPLLSKWIVVRNGSDKTVRLDSFVAEILAAVEGESAVGDPARWKVANLHVETDYAFGGSMSAEGSSASVHWLPDPTYTSQVNYDLQTPCLLECKPPLGPGQDIAAGASWESFRVFELVHDSTDRERQGLAQRRMYRLLSPWVTENPVLMHVRSAKPEAVRLAIDQCADVGFEMVIMTFGSGFDFESRDAAYQEKLRDLAEYASSKGIALGGYSLLASRGAGTAADNTVGKARFGVSPCLGAQWGVEYLAQLKSMIQKTGLSVLEHDGSYPGDTCAATNHPFHRGLEDSQWVQWRAVTDFYRWCRSEGVFLNIPDWYFLNGGNKTGMGYREVNWSLPREYQEIIERQNIYDGTWEKTPGMGWMFVPLTEYQGGGEAATIEPLKDHLEHYEQRLANLFGAGVIACYRGPRLYDTEETRAVVKRWTDFYHRHRAILNSDIIHLRRPDGRDWDGWLHVNPRLPERGLAVLFNPLPQATTLRLSLPLYYTGLKGKARIATDDTTPRRIKLDATGKANIEVKIPAKGWTRLLISE
jgi:hypothetical protein